MGNKQPYQLLSAIKKASWSSRERYLQLNPGEKFLNAYSLFDMFYEPRNWTEIAEKCSTNHKHEHFGKKPEDILTIWNTKKEYKGNEGNTLDDYIKLKIEQTNLADLMLFKQKQIDAKEFTLVQKTEQFDKLYDDLLQKLTYISSEIWLTSDVGLNLRCDSMFSIYDDKANTLHGIIMEWKSLDNMSMSNHFNKLQGPLKGYDNCDHLKFTVQTHLYKYILDRYQIFDNVMTNLYNFNSLAYQKIKPAFQYSKEHVEEMIDYAKIESKRRNQTT